MIFRRVLKHCLAIVVVFTMCRITSHSVAFVCTDENISAKSVASQDSIENNAKILSEESYELRSAKPKDRASSIRALMSSLGLVKGSAIADIGAGNGKDTWVFAEIVGKTGKVYAEEIVEDKIKSLTNAAEQKNLAHVIAVLGRSDDPCLPSDSVDLVYINRVYHHFAKSREMLRGIWRSLKPGGYLVVIDQRRGTLRDWVPRHIREKKHHWIAETTVVRETREEGFIFFKCAEHLWHEKDPFVLIFQRPEKLKAPGNDPDQFMPLAVDGYFNLFLPPSGRYQNPVFVALGESRSLIGPILEHSNGRGLDIVLEEWATQKEERPWLPHGVSLPSVLTKTAIQIWEMSPSTLFSLWVAITLFSTARSYFQNSLNS